MSSRATKMITGLEGKTYEAQLEYISPGGDKTAAFFKYLKVKTRQNCSAITEDRTRNNEFK